MHADNSRNTGKVLQQASAPFLPPPARPPCAPATSDCSSAGYIAAVVLTQAWAEASMNASRCRLSENTSVATAASPPHATRSRVAGFSRGVFSTSERTKVSRGVWKGCSRMDRGPDSTPRRWALGGAGPRRADALLLELPLHVIKARGALRPAGTEGRQAPTGERLRLRILAQDQ